MKSKIISISAISAGFVAICLLVGAYFEVADLFTVVISSVFVTLPLYFNSYKGSVLTFLVGGVIAFICSGFNIISLVFPAYFAFFGIYPIVRIFLTEKKVNKYAGFIFGLIWFVAVAYGLYFYYLLVMGATFEGLPEWIINYLPYLVAVIAIVFYFIYDKFVLVARKATHFYLNKIIK